MILFGIHVAKCAGTTLFLRAQSQLQFNEAYSCTDLARNFTENRMEFLHTSNYSTLRLVFGHFLHEEMLKILPGEIRMFAGLREPHARFRSQLRYMARYRKQRGLPMVDIGEEIKLRDNVMCRTIVSYFPTLAGEGTLAERALRVLDYCWCVYFAERFDETTAPIFESLRIAPEKTNWNVNKDNSDDSGIDEPDLSGARLDQDIILYETALKRYTTPDNVSRSAADIMAKFRAEPLRAARLRQSFYRATFQQYRDDNVLEDVIHHRTRLMAELQAELNRYTELYAQQEASRRS